ncbi:MAG: hypothetical protein AUJ34_03510 [Parcubacteria group bacterium CG1_02_41_12]|nr:MAG: hypothetical protein AUJ34_03510 [Parcubacteria group bacterium CG1_02_41_12]PIP67237.1 MAG: hypothetical protein COW93_01345 [Parcubacteria group bacterium CG22_combo_CG10-13_8_21_14_all_41_9]PIQ78924.1 MAG: hypothetical protein COV79_04810 [Parcubacteria group bacterium CG11_big_fil_rev_8_21_14_0_20_41_14]PIR56742.1 MAG: hypothetical protein COU72_04520 [Parcubacteria group bacterium CG10_big_fil_rev_8_21_14_0_10_41_35]
MSGKRCNVLLKQTRKKRSKAMEHALQRANERFCVSLSRRQLRDLAAEIKSGKCERIEVRFEGTGRRVELYRVHLPKNKNHEAIVVFDPNLKCITTFLSPGSFEGRSRTKNMRKD